jgi:OOP family OmpA-OmpF porin
MNSWSGTAPSAVATVATPVAMPNPGADKGQYAAIPVGNLPKAADATRGKSAVPVVLKLKDGARQIIGANSTESKLYQFLIDPSKEVDIVDPTKDWIGFDRIYFETNKATLTNESLWQLSNVASILKRFPTAKIKIGGYTDNSGNPLLNLRLSKERAEAAMASLVSLGVPAERLTAAGYGALDNIATNDTEEGRALNRRVGMQVTQK